MPTTKEQKAYGWLSVTEVLDSFIPKGLLSWYLKTGAKEAKRLSTVAMKIGRRVDELICEDVKTGSYKLSAKDPIEVKNCMEAWEAFKRDYQPNITDCQVEVKSPDEKLIGHIDLVLNNRVTDIKCASSIKDNYWLQTGKYEAMYLLPTDGLAILRLDKNLATYQYMTHEQAQVDPVECVRVFDGLFSAYKYYHPKDEKENV